MSGPPSRSVVLLGLVAAASVSGWMTTARAGSALATDPNIWVYDSKGRCDPFIPLVREGRVVPCDSRPGTAGDESKTAVPTLGGILWDAEGRSIALINGGETKTGDTVDGYRVSEIHRDEVVLTRESERVLLRIGFGDAKPPKQGTGREEVKGR